MEYERRVTRSLYAHESERANRKKSTRPRANLPPAYLDTGYALFLPALICTILPLIPGVLTVNFKLDDRHNAIETKTQNMLSENETSEEAIRQRVAAAEEKARRDVGVVQ